MRRAELQGNLAMTVTLVSGAMLFITLFMGYAVYRTNAPFWPPLNIDKVPLTWPWISSMIIALSSWTCYQARSLAQKGEWKSAQLFSLFTIFCGLSFVGTQTLLWRDLKMSGIMVDSGVFASILYGFTWIHALHMVLGLGGLVFLHLTLLKVDSKNLYKVMNVERFWHFLGIVWAFMFAGLFLF
ncbi:MAG: cytochrome c oxidase subunit 3 [Proteobacteria bacterium]|nr:cytochrome c oxidase subunit 3 [Pseudomonadota bacterium]